MLSMIFRLSGPRLGSQFTAKDLVMRCFKLPAMVIASGSALVCAAQAADLPLGGPRPAYGVTEYVPNWYLRADVGYWFSTTRGDSVSSFSDVAAVDVGIGYRAGWLRADVTTSFAFQPRFASNSATASPDVSARINVITTLFNGYADLGTWYGITPYVGAGIGFSYTRPIEFTSVSVPASAAGNPGNFDFSWDATVGLSYPLVPNWVLDANYRYLHVGAAETNLAGVVLNFGDMNFHELRMGVRYTID
jgi:opacity protein-like surface antigen